MATAVWKFHITVPTGTFGDVEFALRQAGFAGTEAAKLYAAIFDTTELDFSLRKDFPIDPAELLDNLVATGLMVNWINRPSN